jgi:hypothetical protein
MGLTFFGPNDTPMKLGVEEEVLEQIEFEPGSGHWLWTGNCTPLVPETGRGGYGRINFKAVVKRAAEYSLCSSAARSVLVHRYLYWCYFGSIPDEAVIDHDRTKCADRLHHCCSPLHTTAVTIAQNTVRGAYERRWPHKTHQPLFDPEAFEAGVFKH